jgi:hypothetical protein
MATMKKAQTGKNVPKGMVESEMFPGKMIPKSKSNYYTGEYSKMVKAGKSSAPKPKGMNFDKKSFDKLPVLNSKVTKKPKAQLGRLVKAAVKSGVKKAEKNTAKVMSEGQFDNLIKEAFRQEERQRLKSMFKEIDAKEAVKKAGSKMKSGGMIKRADGSYSKRGLWDNIRANKGSGKKPTAAMLKQEKKIKAKTKK